MGKSDIKWIQISIQNYSFKIRSSFWFSKIRYCQIPLPLIFIDMIFTLLHNLNMNLKLYEANYLCRHSHACLILMSPNDQRLAFFRCCHFDKLKETKTNLQFRHARQTRIIYVKISYKNRCITFYILQMSFSKDTHQNLILKYSRITYHMQ